MAVYNEILAGRFNRALQKMLSMKAGPPAPQLSSEIIPTHAFFSGVETRYLEAWGTFGTRINVAAGGAGNFGVARFFNPTTSRIVAVLFKMVVVNLGAAVFQYDLTYQASVTGGLGTPGNNPQPLDTRLGTAAGVCTITSKNNSVATSAGVNILTESLATSASTDFILPDVQEIPLLPGAAYEVQCETANTQFLLSIWWRERVMEDSEVF